MANVGRPSKYNPDFCNTVIDEMAQGSSIEELQLVLNVHKDTIYEWMKEYSDFSDAVKRGIALSEGWWRTEGRKALRERDFNYTGWYMNMRNRFGWSDKTDVNHSGKLEGNNQMTVRYVLPDKKDE
jgi:transposase